MTEVEELVAAVQAGDAAKVRTLITAKPKLVNMDMAASDEHRALHFAVLRRDAVIVRLLMEAGADANKGIWPHRDATSPLVIARDREYGEIVEIIEEQQLRRRELIVPAFEADEEREKLPIEVAIEEADEPRIRELISADPGLLREISRDGGLVTLAVKSGHLSIVKLLLDLGADVDERITLEELEEPTYSWGYPLWWAARENRREIAELLLDRGADPNANVYASGWPLRNAWDHEDPALKNLLLARGAKVHPYMVAESHDVEEAKRLLSVGPSESAVEELAWSAADHGCPEILALALEHLDWPKSDRRWHWIMIQPIRGAEETPDDHLKCLEVLLKHGVDPNVSRFGQTALHFAAARRSGLSDEDRALFAGMLIDYGAKLDLRDDLLRSTPLGWACRWGRKELAKLLMDRGAPFGEPDAEPWATPQAWLEKTNNR